MVRADAASARDGARGGLDTLAEMAHLAWLLTVATLAGTTTGCALSIAGGADRNTQPDGAAVGWQLGLRWAARARRVCMVVRLCTAQN